MLKLIHLVGPINIVMYTIVYRYQYYYALQLIGTVKNMKINQIFVLHYYKLKLRRV